MPANGGVALHDGFEAPSKPQDPSTPASVADGDDFARGTARRQFGGWDLGPMPTDPSELRRELSKSYAGVDKEGLRKMEEEAKKRRVLLQQSLAVNRGDPFMAARQTVRTERGGDVGSIAANTMEQVEPEKDEASVNLLTFG